MKRDEGKQKLNERNEKNKIKQKEMKENIGNKKE
jgi:hypothetical protein